MRYTECWITATHCNTLQHTATHCNTLQHTAAFAAASVNALYWMLNQYRIASILNQYSALPLPRISRIWIRARHSSQVFSESVNQYRALPVWRIEILGNALYCMAPTLAPESYHDIGWQHLSERKDLRRTALSKSSSLKLLAVAMRYTERHQLTKVKARIEDRINGR